MTQRRNRAARRLLTGGALAAGLLAATTASAQAAVTASFANGALTVTGDSLDNNITVSRNAAGQDPRQRRRGRRHRRHADRRQHLADPGLRRSAATT